MRMFFKNYAEMEKCLLKWQDRLGLNDWYFSLSFGDTKELGEDTYGISHIQYQNKCGAIKILKEEYFKPNIIKEPQEKTLIHELLHFRFPYYQDDDASEKGMANHQFIEEMARALYMAEYKLDSNWFTEEK